jgi:hypothetical protein
VPEGEGFLAEGEVTLVGGEDDPNVHAGTRLSDLVVLAWLISMEIEGKLDVEYPTQLELAFDAADEFLRMRKERHEKTLEYEARHRAF